MPTASLPNTIAMPNGGEMAEKLSGLLDSLRDPVVGQFEPHWGTRAVARSLETLAASAGLDLSSLSSSDPRQAADRLASSVDPQALQKALGDVLSSAVRLPSDAQPALSAEALEAPMRALRAALEGALQAASAALPHPELSLPQVSVPIPVELQEAAARVGDATGKAVFQFFVDPDVLSAAKAGGGTVALATSGALKPGLFVLAAAVTILGVGLAALEQRRQTAAAGLDLDEDTGVPTRYDPEAVAAYFRARPVAVASRALQVARELAGVGLGLLMDQWTGSLQKNEATRARQMRLAIDRLGPAYVKVAQAVSTRVDLLSEAYLREVQLLQDRVRPFDTPTAVAILERDLGMPLDRAFKTISDRPVASASLGQVYKAQLVDALGGSTVAVKVQRPGVLSSVALDLYLMRSAAVTLRRHFPEVLTSDWSGIIDNWAVRFFEELDYVTEGRNLEEFAANMGGLKGIVTPKLFPQLCSRRIITTEWIDGEKLSESRAEDVRELCSTLLSCYLIQLLESGFLHADPHPGNLIRTPDGKICVIDHGLYTRVNPDQRFALLEYIAHLSVGDYDSLAVDLYNLGFVPEGSPDLKEAGVIDIIGRILDQLVAGGGAKKLNIDAVTKEVEQLSAKYKFQIPAYFALILRAFSVIEGIALRVDPDYSIVKECFPYLSRRLLADDSPRSREALRQLLYGRDKRINLQRLVKLADGFSAFTTDGLKREMDRPVTDGANVASASGTAQFSSNAVLGANMALASSLRGDATPSASASPRASGAAQAPASGPFLDQTAKDALRTIFRPGTGSYFQEILVAEVIASVDALSREAFIELARLALSSGAASFTLSTTAALGPLRPFVLPFPLPLELLARLAPAVKLTEEDKIAVSNIRTIFEFLAPNLQVSVDPAVAAAVATRVLQSALSEGLPLAQELAPGLSRTGSQVVNGLVQRAGERLAEDLSASGLANGAGQAPGPTGTGFAPQPASFRVNVFNPFNPFGLGSDLPTGTKRA